VQHERARTVVRRYYDEVFTNRNSAALDELIAPDFVGHSAAFGTYTLADMKRDITFEHENMPEDETIVEEQIVEADRVVTRWTYRWKHTAPLFGETPTGQWLTMEGVHIDRVGDGKIVERWEIKDFWGVVRQMGGQVEFPPGGP
jgi:predicted ester cyclase